MKVFIVEDSANSQVALSGLVSAVGMQVVGTASTQEAALRWLSGRPSWDLAIVDLMLQDGASFDLIRRCKESAPVSRVVVFSAYVTDVIRSHCHRLGADLVFRKEETARLAEFLEQARPG